MEKIQRVLIAEDDQQLGFILKDSLEEEGYAVTYCPDGETAWEEYQRTGADICLLDINMPSRDGYSLARKIRARSDVIPILFLTAKTMKQDKLRGFETGGDDYITKPFDMEELLSRMQVFLRRNSLLLADPAKRYSIGRLVFIPDENRLLNAEHETFLTTKESQLLRFFCDHANRILKREDILVYVWGKNDYFLGRSMDVFLTRLRKILKAETTVSIETIHFSGYRFNNPAAASGD
jgi:DNA-binding response OmpR family regulator